jgi:hypothetical protein
MNKRLGFFVIAATGVALLIGSACVHLAGASPPSVADLPLNGVNLTKTNIDLCVATVPNPSPTCIQANAAGEPKAKVLGTNWGYVPVVSPSPTAGQYISYNANGLWTPGGSISSVVADSPLTGNGSSGSHLACATCGTTNTTQSISGAKTFSSVSNVVSGSMEFRTDALRVDNSGATAFASFSFDGSVNRFLTIPDVDGTLIGSAAVGGDVASSGAGAQSTTIATAAASGAAVALYRASIVFSCPTADTVSAQVVFKDAINATTQTLTPISSASCGTNGTTSATTALLRVDAFSTVVAKISLSSQATTTASAVIERLN